MYAPPNPKKLAYLKAQADELLLEAQRQREIEKAYAEHMTAQVDYARQVLFAVGV